MPSAKEVEQFGYCAHNWWLAKQGASGAGDAARRGQARHDALGAQQTAVEREKRDYRYALRWAFRILGVAASATFLTLELLYLRAVEQHVILLSTAIVATAASGALLVIAFLAQIRYRREQRASGLVPGRLLASDLAEQTPLLSDVVRGLSGRPDYILQTREGPTPVEVKSGRTPDHPYRSHTLQLACYLRLLDANGQAPQYGLLQYPDGIFRVDWTPQLKADLDATLAQMQAATLAGRADRDHEQAGRCRGCARRAACEQKLA
ncbi:MAG: Dna2/Cas4 domain-containing protein [Candidatus Thermoplasmatota archaeon]